MPFSADLYDVVHKVQPSQNEHLWTFHNLCIGVSVTGTGDRDDKGVLSISQSKKSIHPDKCTCFCLFDLILYVHSTIFQLCGTVLPGFNQY